MSAESSFEIQPAVETDLTIPPAPRAPRFDPEQGGWILSRYADVSAALREPRLWPVVSHGEDQAKTRDEAGRLRLRPDVQEALSAARLAAWQAQVEPTASAALRALPSDRAVDLLGEFARPWCLSVAMLVTGADPAERERLSQLGAAVFAGTGTPDGSLLKTEAARATAELERVFERLGVPMGEPTFIAISQTTARLLSNAWLALVSHPAEYARLRGEPELMPRAVEEMLRYAGIVRRVFRWATEDVELGGVTIRKGERALLMLASANRDPEQFPEPDRLDVARPIAAHVSLGMGRNSCVGATLIRMAASVATRALVETFPEAGVDGNVEWHVGSGFCFPKAVRVWLGACR